MNYNIGAEKFEIYLHQTQYYKIPLGGSCYAIKAHMMDICHKLYYSSEDKGGFSLQSIFFSHVQVSSLRLHHSSIHLCNILHFQKRCKILMRVISLI